MQEPWVGPLIWEDPTWQGATKPVYYNYWACALDPGTETTEAHAVQQEKPLQWEGHAPQL